MIGSMLSGPSRVKLSDAALSELTVNGTSSRLVRRLRWRSVPFVPIVARAVWWHNARPAR